MRVLTAHATSRQPNHYQTGLVSCSNLCSTRFLKSAINDGVHDVSEYRGHHRGLPAGKSRSVERRSEGLLASRPCAQFSLISVPGDAAAGCHPLFRRVRVLGGGDIVQQRSNLRSARLLFLIRHRGSPPSTARPRRQTGLAARATSCPRARSAGALPSLEGVVGLARFLVIGPIHRSAVLLHALIKGFDRRVVVVGELDAIHLNRILHWERNATTWCGRWSKVNMFGRAAR